MSVLSHADPSMPWRQLWARAPLWRLFAILASLLTILFLLFPPRDQARDSAAAPLADQASFTPPSGFGASEAARQPATAPVAAPQAAGRLAAATPTAAAAEPVSDAPRDARLSMLTSGPATPPNGSGLEPAMTGRLYSGSLVTTGFTVPLPPGHWAILARTKARTATASGMAYYLGRIENRRLVGAVTFVALRNDASAGGGFPESQLCAHIDPQRLYVFVEGALAPADHQACWTIDSYYAQSLSAWADQGSALDGLERAAGGDLAAKGVSYPQDLVEVRFTRSDRSGFLEASYLFSPEASGVPSREAASAMDSDWTAANVVHQPRKLAYLTKIQAWGQRFWPRFEAAFAQGMSSDVS